VRAQVEAQVGAQVSRRILLACAEAPLSSAEIVAAFGHKQLSGNLRKALTELRKAGFLEYTISDKPNCRLQKYRLTDAGRRLLKSMQE
jgi:ATP-dependent DNA helicase RecG